ncbi:hypothetical protein TNCV_2131491 [Trichonephila clavipes]|nr:hypothetical protein TNCV_2131491 [Trichonephila clavipes]
MEVGAKAESVEGRPMTLANQKLLGKLRRFKEMGREVIRVFGELSELSSGLLRDGATPVSQKADTHFLTTASQPTCEKRSNE